MFLWVTVPHNMAVVRTGGSIAPLRYAVLARRTLPRYVAGKWR